jgi:hypothetical protein
MRKSRTYGSVRGACGDTHVPTATGLPCCDCSQPLLRRFSDAGPSPAVPHAPRAGVRRARADRSHFNGSRRREPMQPCFRPAPGG